MTRFLRFMVLAAAGAVVMFDYWETRPTLALKAEVTIPYAKMIYLSCDQIIAKVAVTSKEDFDPRADSIVHIPGVDQCGWKNRGMLSENYWVSPQIWYLTNAYVVAIYK